MSNNDGYITIPQNKVVYLKNIPIFIKTIGGKYVKFGKSKRESKIGRLEKTLYIKSSDNHLVSGEIRKNWTSTLKNNLSNNDPVAVKKQLNYLAEEELFQDPRNVSEEMMETYKYTVQSLIDAINLDMMNMLVRIADKCGTTAQHSINCMTIGMALATYLKWTKDNVFAFAMCCLLHDIGKLEIPEEILQAPRKLTNVEFDIMKTHTKIGASILSNYDLGSENLNQAVRDCARYHHEKLDGSGYWGLQETHISTFNQILSLIDCYEALTSNDRPYRSAADEMTALRIIKKDTINGKYSKKWFEKFVTNFAI